MKEAKDITPDDVIATFGREAAMLDDALHRHPQIGAILNRNFSSASSEGLKLAYCKWLKITEQYVSSTVPMLHAAGTALKDGDSDDKEWSSAFLKYKDEETDHDDSGNYGHDAWAQQGLRALGAPESLITAPAPWNVKAYHEFFVTDAPKHPYAILGAKGILEHLSVRNSPKLEAALLASGIPNIEQALQFIRQHGVLDIEHVRGGNENIKRIKNPEKLKQILLGAYMTSGFYRSFLAHI